jgi:hypothetical protein
MRKKAEASKPIGEEQLREAYDTMLDYKKEKANLDARITENEKFWRLEHWDFMSDKEDNRVKPRSAWLDNVILNKHADAMDNYPEANILPRERGDEEAAKILSKVIPTVMENCEFQATYSDGMWDKMKYGTAVYGVFWDNKLNNGLGDINIKVIDMPNIFWKGGVKDIQDSPNVFFVTMIEGEVAKEKYGIELRGSSNLPIEADNIHQSEDIDTSGQVALIDWYYKKNISYTDINGIHQNSTILHYCQFCEQQVIYSTENEGVTEGLYQHGKYPFVFDVLYPYKGSIAGFGFIDLVKDDQLFTDKLRQAILENAMVNARPRNIIRSDGGINEDELNDLSKPTIHTSGNLGENDFRQLVASPLSGIYESVYLNQIQQMKDTSGNTASSQGQVSSVTTASGIASLQEAAGKLSRDTNLGAYRAFKKIVELVIELIRQFYDESRSFRIVGDDGGTDFVTLGNAMVAPQEQGMAFGIDLGSRLPIFDIVVKPQKQSAYSRESQNQTALNLYNMGFFAPNNTDSALACLDMMDFDEIQKVKDKIKENGTLYDQVVQLQNILMQLTPLVDAQNGTNLTAQIMQGQAATMADGQGGKNAGEIKTSKGSLSAQAANATKNSTAPR